MGKEANKVKRMEEEFRKKIDAVFELATKAKKAEKIRKHAKLLEALELCKKHSGPLSARDLHRLDELTDPQVVAEAKYLKKAIAPNLRLKQKEGKKMIAFTVDEIIQQIQDCIL